MRGTRLPAGSPAWLSGRVALLAIGALACTLLTPSAGAAASMCAPLPEVAAAVDAVAHGPAALCIDSVPAGEPLAIAVHAGAVVAGTDLGAYVWAPDRRTWRLLLASREVRALASAEPWLLIATDAGIYTWAGGSSQPTRLADTAGLDVFALALAAGGELLAATADGLLAARLPGAETAVGPRPGDPVPRLAFARTTLPEREVRGVAVAGQDVWAATPGTLWRRRGAAAFERVRTGLGDGWWELRSASRQQDLTLLAVPAGLWRESAAGLERVAAGIGAVVGMAPAGDAVAIASERDVRCVDPGTFPGGRTIDARVTRAVALAAAGPGATALLDRRGVSILRCSVAAGAGAPIAAAQPGESPAGASPALRADPANGLGEFASETSPASRRASRNAEGAKDPELPSPAEIALLRAAVMRYLDLAPGRLRALDARARERARWPEVRLTLGGDLARGSSRAHDQSFTSGAVRDLFDVSRDRDVGSDVGLALTWDLAQSADPGFEIEISRERRELIELRDQVLERVHRLYFERMRLRVALAEMADPAGPEGIELQVRDRELTAALDAWSDGALSRRAERAP